MDIAIPLYDRFTALDAIGPYEVLQPGGSVEYNNEEAGAVWLRAEPSTSCAAWRTMDPDDFSAVVQCRWAVPAQSNFRCPAGRTHGAIPMGSEPGELYELHLERDEIELLNEPVLLVALDGYIDAGSGVRLAVEHLLALGHRQIGYLGVGNRMQSNRRRHAGYCDALTAAGVLAAAAVTTVTATQGT